MDFEVDQQRRSKVIKDNFEAELWSQIKIETRTLKMRIN